MNIRDSVCVLGGVLLGCGISYKMVRVQSAQLKQLQALDVHLKRMEEKTVTELQDKLEVIQTHQNELGKAETDDKKALERKFEEILTSLKKEGANIVERSRKLNIQYNASLESQLKLLKEKCDSLEQSMKDEVNKISLKLDRLTEETTRISRKIESSTHEEIPVEVLEASMSKGLLDNYQTSTQCSISSSQHDVEEDSPIGEVEEDSSIDIFRYDIFILHGEKDDNEAYECKTFLMNNFQHISNLQVALPEDLLTTGTHHLPGLSSLLDSCRLVFLFMTKNLESDPVAGFGKQMNLLQSIKDPLKGARLIPLQVNEAEISDDLTSTIIPLKYVNDTTDRRQFPHFKRKFEKLVDTWRKALPRERKN